MTRIDNLVAVCNWHELAETITCQTGQTNKCHRHSFYVVSTAPLTILTTESSLAYSAIKRSESKLEREKADAWQCHQHKSVEGVRKLAAQRNVSDVQVPSCH